MSAVLLWGWDATNEKWVKIQVNDEGKLELASLEDAEVSQATPESLKHVPHGYYSGGPSYLPLAVDSAGKLLVTLSSLAELNDIDDVDVASPTNNHFLYYDAATGFWKARALVDADIPAAIARDAEVTAAISTHADDEDAHHAKYTDAEAVAAVEAAGLALASGKRVNLIQALTSDHTWSGITATLTAGESLAIGDIVYAKSDGKMWKADADAAATMPVIAIATATISADATGEFLILGFMRDDTWNWTVGGLLYCDTTAGALTQTAPSGSGDQVQVVGVAITADIILFNPSYELVEIS